MPTVTKPKPKINLFGLMAETALRTYLAPKLAVDAAVDLTPVLRGLSPKSFDAAAQARLKVALDAALKPAKSGKAKLAADADVADVQEVLDQLQDMAPQIADLVVGGPAAAAAPGDPPADGGASPEDTSPSDKSDIPPGNPDAPIDTDDKAPPGDPADTGDNPDAGDDAKILTFLQGKLSPEDMTALKAMLQGGGGAMDTKVPKTAMDAAIAAATKGVRTQMRQVQDAEREVLPFVGQITVAMDSAEDVFKFALDKMGVDVKGVHPSAYGPILRAQAKPGQAQARQAPAMAADAAAETSYSTKYGPALGRLKSA